LATPVNDELKRNLFKAKNWTIEMLINLFSYFPFSSSTTTAAEATTTAATTTMYK
jgi:hypothetical protein